MAIAYLTTDGDMLDLICYRRYGHASGAVEKVLEANPLLRHQPVRLPRGIRIVLPDLPPRANTTIKLWD